MTDRTFYYYRTPSGRERLTCSVNCTVQFDDEYNCRHCCNSPSSCELADREFDDFTEVSEEEFDAQSITINQNRSRN